MSDRMTRREFVGGAIAAGGAAALPAASWARVLGANETIRVGLIGCGTQGMIHLRSLTRHASSDNVAVHRVCDVYRTRLEEAAKASAVALGRASMEYRDVLDDPDVDAVVVATPDHWQARIASEALAARKSVLVETPFAHTIAEALALRDAAAGAPGVLAVGARACADQRYREAQAMIRQTRIGKVSWSQASFCVNSRVPIFNRRWTRPISPIPGTPDHVWWDRWLGHEWGLAPAREIDAERFFRFPKYHDYSGGLATEFLFNELAGLLLAVAGPKGEQPARVTCGGGRYNLFDERETPDQVIAVLDYGREHTITLAASAATETGLDPVIRGRHGTIRVTPTGLHFAEQSDFYPEFRNVNRRSTNAGMVRNERGQWVPEPPRGEAHFSVEIEPSRDVMDNFLSAVRGDAEPACGAELGCAAAIGIRLAIDAYRDRAVKLWDAKAEAPPAG